jgi:hypothetical protein
VLQLRGSVHIEYTLARMGAERLWRMVNEGGDAYVHALGALTGEGRGGGVGAPRVWGWRMVNPGGGGVSDAYVHALGALTEALGPGQAAAGLILVPCAQPRRRAERSPASPAPAAACKHPPAP